MIKDPKEKETIARAAYTSVKDEDGLRQWPLAAYELARCYAQRGVADTNLLKPYIDVQLNLEYHKQKTGRLRQRKLAGMVQRRSHRHIPHQDAGQRRCLRLGLSRSGNAPA